MKVELVVLDLDGTLLDSGGRLPQRNAAAIAQVLRQGTGVAIATGKTYWSAAAIIAELELTLPGVFAQGLLVCAADGTVLREIRLNYELVNRVLAYLEAQGLPYNAQNRSGLLVREENSYNRAICSKYGEPRPRIMGTMAGRAEALHINKLLVSDRDNLQARRDDLQRRYGQETTILQAVPEFIEILPQGTSKGGGVRWMLQQLQIAPTAMMAVGDGENDMELLKMAGLAVAVGNARPELKAVADAVVGSNNDAGVAEALTRFVLASQ
jgi:Cof subfamily protein (haloacid dehalogenase superfamily)